MEIIIAIIGATVAIIVAVVTAVTTAIKVNTANMDRLHDEIRDVRNLLIAHISGHSHYVGVSPPEVKQNPQQK